MSAGVLATINTFYSSLTPVERDIADYILTNGKDVVFMPITDLAFRCSVCETSVVRFCRRLGLAGYQAFRLELSSSLAAQQLLLPEGVSQSDDPVERVLDGVYHKHLSALNSTRSMQDSRAFKNIVEHLALARQVYFFGLNRSVSTAFTACQIMMEILHKGCFALDTYTQRLQASLITSFDSVFFFSHHGKNEEMLGMAHRIKHSGAFCVGVTCSAESPLNKLCDENLYCGCNIDPSRPSEMDELTGKAASAYVIETLCSVCLNMVQADKTLGVGDCKRS